MKAVLPYFSVLFFILTCLVQLHSQEVTGYVSNQSNQPLTDVLVQWQSDPSYHARTGTEGRFYLELPDGSFTRVGLNRPHNTFPGNAARVNATGQMVVFEHLNSGGRLRRQVMFPVRNNFDGWSTDSGRYRTGGSALPKQASSSSGSNWLMIAGKGYCDTLVRIQQRPDWRILLRPDLRLDSLQLYHSWNWLSPGEYDEDMLKAAIGVKWAQGPDEGRFSVVSGADCLDSSGNCLRILYPRGGNQSANSGAQFKQDLGGNFEEAVISYWVRFDPDFDWRWGGKLPGLGGSVSMETREKEWSGRLMWRPGGKVQFYMHFNGSESQYWWDLPGDTVTFVPGKWHHLKFRLVLNTPGQKDGIMEGWLDGVRAGYFTDKADFRGPDDGDVYINHLFFSTFFGGSSDAHQDSLSLADPELENAWQPYKDEYAWFDELEIEVK